MHKPLAAAVLLALSLSSLAAQEPLGEIVNVTAIELSLDVRDANGNVPPDLKPSDFIVLESGVERQVTALEYEGAARVAAGTLTGEADAPTAEAAAAAARASVNVVLYFDLELSNHATMLAALRGLAKDAQRLTALGAVDVVITNPEIRWIARGVTDPAALAATLKTLEQFPAHDRLTRHRMEMLAQARMRAQPGAMPKLKLAEARMAIQQEEVLIERFQQRMTRVVSAVPRRPLNAMFLVSDGFDLQPIDFYEPFLEQRPEAAAGPGNGGQVESGNLRHDWSAGIAPKHEEFSRSLAAAGWTVNALNGGITADFLSAASESGHGRVKAFMMDPGGGPPAVLGHRRDALHAITEATGGEIASGAPRFASMIAAVGDRVRLTYQVPRAPDAKPRSVEVRSRRPGLKVRTSRWTSSSTPEITAAARALEQFAGVVKGELPVAARLQLEERPQRRNSARGALEIRAGLEPVGPLRAQLTATSLRVTIAVESESRPASIVHQAIDNYDLSKLRRILFTAPMQLAADARRISLVLEELTSGAWGGTTIDLPAKSRGRTFTSAGWDEQRTTLAQGPQGVGESDGIAWMSWSEGLARAQAERKLLFVAVQPRGICLGCSPVNRALYRHASFQRHMATSFVPVSVDQKQAHSLGIETPVAVADPWGRVHYEWTTEHELQIVSRLTLAARFTPSLVTAGEKLHAGDAAEAHFTLGYVALQMQDEARPHYERARDVARNGGNAALSERAEIHLALLDGRGARRTKAKETLERIAATTRSDANAAEALIVLGNIHQAARETTAAADAFSRAAARAPKGSELEKAALALSGADIAPVIASGGELRLLKPIQLVRPKGAIVTGRVPLQTLVRDARVDEVRFYVDDKLLDTDRTPPFTVRADLGDEPRLHTFRVQAFGRDGKPLGDDTLRVNERHDELAVRIVSPRAGEAAGRTRVELDIQRPAAGALDRVELYWNDEQKATLRQAPFTAELTLPKSPGYIRAVAVLADGRTAEDAVTLNAGGYAEAIDVELVELYVRVNDEQGRPLPNLTASDFVVLDGETRQEVVRAEFVESPPLLVGLAIDTSVSMNEEILDVQQTAEDFLRNALASDARAFMVAFDEAPRLLHETTRELPALTQHLQFLRAQGSTTVLYDALVFSLLQFEGAPGKKAIVVVSDGDDRSSRYSAEDVATFARRAGVEVYAIVFEAHPGFRRDLVKLTNDTGGKAFFLTRGRTLDAIYQEIDERLRSQYVLTVRASRKAGDVRPLEVRVGAGD